MDNIERGYGGGGFFELKTPQDLLEKLRHDYRRILDSPANTYCAFDFFVTANHMVDWIWPVLRGKAARAQRREDAETRICEHLADGAKHFSLDREHRGVAAIHHEEGAFDPDDFSEEFDIGGLYVTFEPAEAAAMGQDTMGVPELAGRVLNYWERRIGSNVTQLR